MNAWNGFYDEAAGVNVFYMNEQPMQNIDIVGNRVVFSDFANQTNASTRFASGIALVLYSSPGTPTLQSLRVLHNTVTDAPGAGISVGNPADGLEIAGNSIVRPARGATGGTSVVPLVWRAGVMIDGVTRNGTAAGRNRILVHDNAVSDDLPSPLLQYGVYAADSTASSNLCEVSRNTLTVMSGGSATAVRVPVSGWQLTPSPTVAFTQATRQVARANATVQLPVALSVAAAASVSVQYAVLPLGAGGTAQTPDDYTLAAGTLTFPAGSTLQNIALTVADNPANSGGRNVVVRLRWPSGAWLGATAEQTITIGAANTPPTISAVAVSQTSVVLP